MIKAIFIASTLFFSTVCLAEKTQSPKPTLLVFTNLEHKGKKVWNPSEIEIVPGKYTLELINTLAAPHGFEIKGLVKAIVVPAHGKKTVTVDFKKGEYDVRCHMHPAHVGAEISVE